MTYVAPSLYLLSLTDPNWVHQDALQQLFVPEGGMPYGLKRAQGPAIHYDSGWHS
jgi:hypothetical protein